MKFTLKQVALTLAISVALGSAAQAKTLRLADQGDIVSLDPHSLNEAFQLSMLGNVYEGLVSINKKMEFVPGLATKWTNPSPNVWRFELRKDVKFHDGTPFTADDVVFSYGRARADSSDVRAYMSSVTTINKIDDFTVEVSTSAPNPILPNVLASVTIMSKKWSEDNKAVTPVDKRKGIENAASFKTNGTGPYKVRERQPGTKTVFVRNFNYWDKVEGNVSEMVFTPIGNDSTRVAALQSGEIDFMQPVPVQDVARLNASGSLKVMQGPEVRTIFLGMDQSRDELLFSNVKGKNPFKDKRVRQAFYQSIDIEAIKTRIMRGAAAPAAVLMGPGINGFTQELNQRLPLDQEGAKKLLAEAGYPNGFEVGMDCPNDRYVNDAEICQAVAAMLARTGIKVNLNAQSKLTYFPKILSRNTSFYLLGWVASTYDAHNILNAIMASPAAGGQGQFNLGSYKNPKVDELTKKVQSETDQTKRNAMINEAFKLHKDDIGHIPLHQQALAWGMKKNIDVVQRADNFNVLKWIQIK
jgi:peptide/nickel transport system substrate-binding protein